MSEPIPTPGYHNLYPRKDSLEEVYAELTAQLPLTTSNELHQALMLYHNTLVHLQQLAASGGRAHEPNGR